MSASTKKKKRRSKTKSQNMQSNPTEDLFE